MKKEMDEILKQALTPEEEPDFWLNQKILNQVKESDSMKTKNWKKVPAMVLTTILVIAAGSTAAYAAWKYLAPAQAAERIKDSRLTEAFQSADAVYVNEKQSYAGYDIRLFGIVSGKDLSDREITADGEVLSDMTYSVVAVEKLDGTPMTDKSFFISPLISGYDPAVYNAFTLTGGYTSFTEEGVAYFIAECENVEMFADHTIYLCVLDDPLYNSQAYDYDEVTGEITRNDTYQGVNALFELPIDPSKADQKAAAEKVDKINHPVMPDDWEPEETAAERFMSQITPENIDAYAARVESTVQMVTPDEEGVITYEYELSDGSGGDGEQDFDTLFPDGKTGMSKNFSYSYSCSDGSDEPDEVLIHTFALNEDGTVTFAIYKADVK